MKDLKENFPDLHNIGFDADWLKSRRIDELVSFFMNDELKRSEQARSGKKADRKRARERKP